MANSHSKRRTGNPSHLASRYRGVTSIEYALIASLIAVAIVGGVTATGAANGSIWTSWTGSVVAAIVTALGL